MMLFAADSNMDQKGDAGTHDNGGLRPSAGHSKLQLDEYTEIEVDRVQTHHGCMAG